MPNQIDQNTTEKPLEKAWQDLICKIDGVYSSRVVLDERGCAEKIHILASNQKSPKTVIRDVQSAIMSVFNTSIDYRVISVALIHPQMATVLNFRLKYAGISVNTVGCCSSVSVTLEQGDRAYTGEAACSNARQSRCRGVAQATLNAVAQFTGGNHLFDLDNAEIILFCGQNAALVSLFSFRDNLKLLGSSFVHTDNDTAIVNATLSALNRRIEILSTEA